MEALTAFSGESTGPDFNPEWPEAVQKSWFEAINKLMDRFQKKSGD
jgi:hypothetical protein